MKNAVKKLDFDRGFQRKLLRLMYQDSGVVLALADDLTPECFDSKVDRFVARVMLDAHRNGVTPTKTVLINETRKAAKVGRLKQKDSTLVGTFIGGLSQKVPDKTYIVGEVAKWIRHQKIVHAMLESAELVDRQDDDAILKKLRKVVDYDPVSANSGTGSALFSGARKRAEARAKFVKRGIPTGTGLDNYLVHEGLPPKQIGIVLAPPGRGKTAFLVHLAKSAVLEKGIQVLYISLELDEEVIADRFDAAFSKVQLNKLSSERGTIENTNTQLLQQFGDCVRIKYFPSGTLSVNGIKALLKRLEAEAFYPGLIVIDYLDLLAAAHHYDDRYAELGSITLATRGLAGELDIPIWTATQANRGSMEKEDIGIEDLAESFQKAMIADVIVALAQTPEEKAKQRMRLILAKNRNGYDGITIEVRVDTAKVSFKSV